MKNISWDTVIPILIGTVYIGFFIYILSNRQRANRFRNLIRSTLLVGRTFIDTSATSTTTPMDNLAWEAPDNVPPNVSEMDRLQVRRLQLEVQQMEQLVRYHANSLNQSTTSFRFSIGAAVFGFILIVGGVIWGHDNINSAMPSIISGTIIDAVAGLFFRQSNQARQLMTEFFDKLRVDRQFQEALRLCESITDAHLQSVLKVRLSLFFAGIRDNTDFAERVSDAIHVAAPFHRPETAKPNGQENVPAIQEDN